MAAQPHHKTPPPQPRIEWPDYSHENQTPPWINDLPLESARRGTRARNTAPLAPLKDTAVITLTEVCWDCKGRRYTGAIIHRCPVCNIGYTTAQMKEHASRDRFGATIMPCRVAPGERPHRAFSNMIKGEHEWCPTCYNQKTYESTGTLEVRRTLADLMTFFREEIRKYIADATQIVPVPAFQQSEPTAPPPHIASGMAPGTFTPHLPPLAPERESGEEF